MFKGAITALITPFKNGKVDSESFQRHVDSQIKAGINGLVPCGTTGESPTLTHDEHNLVIELCINATNKRVPVIAGTGSNSTEEAVMMSLHAQKAGADAVLIATPYYNKPTQEGLYQHYKAIHDALDIPIIVYNIPGRSVIDLKDETLGRLAELPRIAGNKDATGDLARISSLRAVLGKRPFAYLSGEDGTALSFNAQGGVGCISVTSNILPAQCVALQDAWFAGDVKRALEIHDELTPIHQAMFCETSPAPVKYAASLLGICTDEIRLPLVMPSEASKERVRTVLKTQGLLK
ncbi:MAG: 4-hydroxy-tetrahydrodipicolinate synthase [Alphaproteobacteria bacterium]|nr:4-hydroxy-tetrahydrodipicolinate synthase [Alphaproteobacteria bacterium]